MEIKINGKEIPGKIKRYLKGSLKEYALWFSLFFYFEILFKFCVFDSFEKESFLVALFNILVYSGIFTIICNLFKNKVRFIINSVFIFIIGFLYSVQIVFYNLFHVFFSFQNLGVADQLGSFLGETIDAILSSGFYLILFFLPFVIYLIKGKKKHGRNFKYYPVYAFLTILGVLCFINNMNVNKDEINGVYYLLKVSFNNSLNVEKIGVLDAYIVDFYRINHPIKVTNEDLVIEEEEEVDSVFDYEKNTLDLTFKDTSNSDINVINEYVKNNNGTSKNSYTGVFENYNLVYITAESFSQIAVSEELTPTLYKLTHSGFIFNNYYTPNVLSTLGGEFQSVTGLYPDNSILVKWRSGTNSFANGLANVFKNKGYNTYAYHDHYYNFQDRNKYLASIGFTNYMGCYNGLEKRMECRNWPNSDVDMINATIDDYINSDKPFLAYYMTVSGHMEYSWNDNNISNKNRSLVQGLNATESAKAYVAAQIELDRALETLINKLEEAGKLDNTIIVLLADHYPYALGINDINSLSTYTRDVTIEANHNSLIIWNPKIKDREIDKVCMSVDVLPTVYNLFNISYDSRLYTGNDIFSNREGLAIFSNGSWISDSGKYLSTNNSFTANKEVDDNYVTNMNSIVRTRLNIARLIMSTNYYNYLFG